MLLAKVPVKAPNMHDIVINQQESHHNLNPEVAESVAAVGDF